MSDQVLVTFKADRALRERFNQAAKINNSTATDAFRTFMGNYISYSQKRKPNVSAISEEEREARRVAVEFARASVSLEGFDTNDVEELKRDERYINGELTLAQYLDSSDMTPVNG